MWRRSLCLCIAPALLSLTLPARPVLAGQFFVYPLKISLPIHMVVSGAGGDRIVKKTLKEKDVVNLALGRPLGTKVDKSREILAAAVARFAADAADDVVVVFDPSQNGLAQVTTTVLTITTLDFERAVLAARTEGHATLRAAVQETTLGDPAQNALHAATIWTAANGKGQGGKASIKGVLAGRMSITTTENGQTATFGGFIVNGKAKLSSKIIGMYTDGVFIGCGDGIVQPHLGEECEFADQSACPGKCQACTCRVCGNDRKDPGEICDGTDNAICDALSPPTPCFADCSGCTQCGDGIISPHEECDTGTGGAPCVGLCLFPECQCGCANDDPAGCPDDLCCSGARCWAVKTGFPSDDPSSPLGALICSNGQSLPSGLCGDLLPPGSTCPDQDADPNTVFFCHECNGKLVHASCTLGAQSCVLDQIGPLP